jgi:hypothetical protein
MVAGLKTADVGEPTVFLRRDESALTCRWEEGEIPLVVFSVINPVPWYVRGWPKE